MSCQLWAFCPDSIQLDSPRGFILGKSLVTSHAWTVSSQPWAFSGQRTSLTAPEVPVQANSVLPGLDSVLRALGIALTVSSWIAPEVPVVG